MKDLLLYIARSLVEHPDDVTVTEKQGDGRAYVGAARRT